MGKKSKSLTKINLFIPPVAQKVFSGGQLTVFEYANGLVDLGYKVTVIPISPSQYPEWFKPKFEILQLKRPEVHQNCISLITGLLLRDKRKVRGALSEFILPLANFGTYSFRGAIRAEWVRGQVPEADVSIATSYETALPVYLYGRGRKFYFCQHYEPFFASERDNPMLAELEARQSYQLPGLSIIANSTWLSSLLSKEIGKQVPVCLNAIDHGVFYPEGSVPNPKEKFVVMSYGGRRAEWKGIHDAAKAILIAKGKIPHLEWRVFGDSLLPPDNEIAPYVALGFLSGSRLRRAYSEAHILLATSWYESFPLFPLEAMACGTTVITTPFGVEDYAKHKKNAYLVAPKEPDAMAAAIIELYDNQDMAFSLSQQALIDSKDLTWEKSVRQLVAILGIE